MVIGAAYALVRIPPIRHTIVDGNERGRGLGPFRELTGRRTTVFQVTEEAAAYVAFQLVEAGLPEGTVIRLTACDNGLILQPGRVESGDVSFEHDGRQVVAVPRALAEDLSNVVLQAEESVEGTRLQLRECG